ncbi:MAG: hypothetical protein E7256_08300 [Lachnospiraceae bacterium]|nr:hypothetical protein [Lachnospiraceae bacterium]
MLHQAAFRRIFARHVTAHCEFICILRRLMLVFYLAAVSVFAIGVWESSTEGKGYTYPNYLPADLSLVIQKENLTKDDYNLLYHQTGLGKVSVDAIKREEDGGRRILKFQKDFFTKQTVICRSIFFTTRQERIQTMEGEYAYELAPLKKGDILITKGTHFFGWRHGHAALVIDEKEGLTLESMTVGQNSIIRSVNSWRRCPSIMVLRFKNASQNTLDKIVEFAKENLNEIPYRMSAGVLSPKYKEGESITGTQCAHLIWYAFMTFGYDIDSDGGRIVTPKDIAESDLLEVVQVYGVDPDDIWP